MSSAPRRLPTRIGVVAVVVAISAVGFVAWRSTDADGGRPVGGGVGAVDDRPTPPRGPALDPPPPAEPVRHLGPQGRVGQFVVGCLYSHSGPNDPIVHPDHPGRSHRHDFYGAVDTDAASTIEGLQAGDTTCDKKVDTAAYWQPTLYDHDEVVEPYGLHAYYRAAPGVDPTTVQTMPPGLALIAGDFTATEPQAGEATGWTCGTLTSISDDPPECAPSAPLHLVLTFADCWDGVHLDSVDHRSHAAYSVDGRCPDGFEVPIPQVTVTIAYPISGPDHDLRLASGNIYSAHGDFWNAWDPAGLQREIDACIHRDAVCDLASNREEEALFSYGTEP